ncbi:MAG: bifunctional phosphopantothenoylcysteine decarboxylase/phosphopantothenate--cysteine ligase CoaBC [Pseudomonadota bacterium]
MASLHGKHIVLGICSGIAAYKTPMLVRTLRAAGAEVEIVLSANAHRFVAPMALQAVSGRSVRMDLWDAEAEAAMGHIELAKWADMVLIAPATANTLAKLASGMADDLLTTLCLATAAPLFYAPAMNQQMFAHPTVAQNLARLTELGYQQIGPDSGDQACGDNGPGRMTEPDAIAACLAASLAPAANDDSLRARRVLITTGPTVEAIDPVRFISNHSSGLQGISIAEAALRAGAEVVLVAGPGVPTCHPDIRRIDVRTALEMYDAVHAELVGVDIFVGVAAVADYRPKAAPKEKMKRSGKPGADITIELTENPDIIASVANAVARPTLVIGFAAETNNTHEHAREKRLRKGLDAIVLNDVSDPSIGFNSPKNAATLIYAQGELVFPRQSKQQLASNLIAQIPGIFAQQLAGTNPASMTK